VSAWRVLACVFLSKPYWWNAFSLSWSFVVKCHLFDEMVHQQRPIVLEHRLSSLIPGEPTGVGPASLNCWLPRLICLWTVVSSGNKAVAKSCCRTLILDSQLLAFTQLGKESATDRTFIFICSQLWWIGYFDRVGIQFLAYQPYRLLCYFIHKNGQIPPLKYLVCTATTLKSFNSWGSLTCNLSFFIWSYLKDWSRPCKILNRFQYLSQRDSLNRIRNRLPKIRNIVFWSICLCWIQSPCLPTHLLSCPEPVFKIIS